MLGSFVSNVFGWCGAGIGHIWPKSLRPTLPPWLRLPNLKSFNFILFHYFYMFVMTILGSILVFPAGGIKYIDALFFAAGSATQSGLNTIDFNKLNTYQQIVLVIIPCLCNPITINTFVVFVRMYWFEKRFQNIVREARQLRHNRTRSRTKSEEKAHPDLDRAERGVQGREIKVLRDTGNAMDPSKTDESNGKAVLSVIDEKQKQNSAVDGDREEDGNVGSDEYEDEKKPEPELNRPSSFHRDIVFEDEVGGDPRSVENQERVPERRTSEQHIAFVENQRNPKDNTALRIPGPRDAERGYKPQRVQKDDDDDDDDFRPNSTKHTSSFEQDGSQVGPPNKPLESESSARHRNPLHVLHIGYRDTESPTTLKARVNSMSTSFAKTFSKSHEDMEPQPYLSYAATIGRNSTFVDLTEEQREELGGIEYRSLKTLAWVLLAYFFGFSILGVVVLLPWIMRTNTYKAIVVRDSQSPVWWGIFTPLSMFTDLGFTLDPDSMISFQKAVLPLLLGCLLIVVGNTGFPCMLRFLIWICSKLVPRHSGVWEEFRFLLDHPRRCFTLLFPRKATWWLFAVLVLFNGIDLIFFVLLDLKDPIVTSLPRGFQFLDGLFQAFSTRTAGFACVDLAELHPGIQVSYLIMMYISVFPIAISVRQTNVYEEKSLGIYHTDQQSIEQGLEEGSRSYLGSHLRRQLSFDLWYIFLGLFFICIVEGSRIEDPNDPAFNIFSIFFEIISSYGTVGLSLGYPNTNASFSAQFKPLSKLIIIAMMIRGRHRGLPYALDRAILLPSEGLDRKKEGGGSRRPSALPTAAADGERTETAVAADIASHVKEKTPTSRSRGMKFGSLVAGVLSAGPVAKKKRG